MSKARFGRLKLCSYTLESHLLRSKLLQARADLTSSTLQYGRWSPRRRHVNKAHPSRLWLGKSWPGRHRTRYCSLRPIGRTGNWHRDCRVSRDLSCPLYSNSCIWPSLIAPSRKLHLFRQSSHRGADSALSCLTSCLSFPLCHKSTRCSCPVIWCTCIWCLESLTALL